MSYYVYIFLNSDYEPYGYCTTESVISDTTLGNYLLLEGQDIKSMTSYFISSRKERAKAGVCPIEMKDIKGIKNNLYLIRNKFRGIEGYVTNRKEASRLVSESYFMDYIKVNFKKLQIIEESDIRSVELIGFLVDKKHKVIGYTYDMAKLRDYSNKLLQLGVDHYKATVLRRNKDIEIYFKKYNRFWDFCDERFKDDSEVIKFELVTELSDKLISKYTLLL